MGWDGKQITGLREQKAGSNSALYEHLLMPNESVKFEYKSIRDVLILTEVRLVSIDSQGLTGRKKEYMSVGFHQITAFSIETAGTFDLDGEFKVWLSGMGLLEFEFVKGVDIKKLAKFMSGKTLPEIPARKTASEGTASPKTDEDRTPRLNGGGIFGRQQ
ncbi:PH domain-containing protein [Lentibacter algarum]|uniref:PH domain-containing protein n=1 Tax=Lentibacter algarum TaxID=576131 RepID=UPI001C07B3FB|nr:PH domain-containing protein [Lentibacter algarum]MBU2982150.1 PH domain-containing protein [Lentibacter algarum]